QGVAGRSCFVVLNTNLFCKQRVDENPQIARRLARRLLLTGRTGMNSCSFSEKEGQSREM
ncbi:MAG: hypothetical protein LBS70_05130, partial [Candidatus Accumulibacter sp.]|nr:hypothetical protein [Accumulibacter sp.]